jgi:hypothetical protein
VLLVLRNTMFEGVLLNNRSLAQFTSAGDLWIPLCIPAVEGVFANVQPGLFHLNNSRSPGLAKRQRTKRNSQISRLIRRVISAGRGVALPMYLGLKLDDYVRPDKRCG